MNVWFQKISIPLPPRNDLLWEGGGGYGYFLEPHNVNLSIFIFLCGLCFSHQEKSYRKRIGNNTFMYIIELNTTVKGQILLPGYGKVRISSFWLNL